METISAKNFSSSVAIRLAEINDVPEIVALDVKIFGYSPEIDIKDRLEEIIFQQKSYVAIDDDTGSVVGFVLCELKKLGRHNIVEVETFAVEENHRSHGIGGALFDSVICQVYQDTSVNFVVLNTNVGNAVALKIYLSRDFEIVKFVEGYYKELRLWAKDPDAFVLAKRIYGDASYDDMLESYTSECALMDHPY